VTAVRRHIARGRPLRCVRDRALTSRSPCPRISIVIAFFFFARPIFLSLAVPQTARRTTSTPPSGRESTRRPKRKGKQSRGRASQCRPPLVRRPRVDPHPFNSISARCPHRRHGPLCAAGPRCSRARIPWPAVTPRPVGAIRWWICARFQLSVCAGVVKSTISNSFSSSAFVKTFRHSVRCCTGPAQPSSSGLLPGQPAPPLRGASSTRAERQIKVSADGEVRMIVTIICDRDWISTEQFECASSRWELQSQSEVEAARSVRPATVSCGRESAAAAVTCRHSLRALRILLRSWWRICRWNRKAAAVAEDAAASAGCACSPPLRQRLKPPQMSAKPQQCVNLSASSLSQWNQKESV